MNGFLNFISNHRKLSVILAVIILVVLIVGIIVTSINSDNNESESPSYNTNPSVELSNKINSNSYQNNLAIIFEIIDRYISSQTNFLSGATDVYGNIINLQPIKTSSSFSKKAILISYKFILSVSNGEKINVFVALDADFNNISAGEYGTNYIAVLFENTNDSNNIPVLFIQNFTKKRLNEVSAWVKEIGFSYDSLKVVRAEGGI